MPRKQKTIHYLYKTTCLVTGRYYIGMHSTTNLEDGYMGSGKRLRYSLRKYGLENHKKEILEFFESRELLIEAEKISITPEMVVDKMCMNLKGGGIGGIVSKEHGLKLNKSGNIAYTIKIISDKSFKDYVSNNSRKSIRKNPRGVAIDEKLRCNWVGRKHKPESIEKLRVSKNVGQQNPQYGTIWITNGTENRKIKKEENIPEGWYRGRK